MTMTGLDNLIAEGFGRLAGQRVGLLCNQATIDRTGRHVLEFVRAGQLRIVKLFGPQHGLFGHTQDNMIEWEGTPDSRFGVPVYSLYGEHRKPTKEMLAGLDVLVIDLPDIGSRYYTFAWTMALCLEAASECGLRVIILDRPNPLGGIVTEGPEIEPGFESFVGLYSVPIRHAMTLGELARMVAKRRKHPEPEVIEVSGWDRTNLFDRTGLPWAMPSPNMPTPATAFVYPGGCLLEGTTASEGRGTTRPFEILGAPYVDAFELCERMNAYDLPGVRFRPTQFQPTFSKFAGELCEGCFVQVVDSNSFRSVTVYAWLIQELYAFWKRDQSGSFWKAPPYEYEYVKPAIDILWGSVRLREAVELGLVADIIGPAALQ